MANCDIEFFGEKFTSKRFKDFVKNNFPLLTYLQAKGMSKYQLEGLEDFNLVSGGADGADSAWGTLAKVYGNSTFNDILPYHYDKISFDESISVEGEYQHIREMLGRNNTSDKSFKGKLLRRNMLQVKKGVTEATFSIGPVKYIPSLGMNFVDGGTSYATLKSILLGIPTYVYDQNTQAWYSYTKEGPTKINTPIIPKNSTLIGTRDLTLRDVDVMNNLILNTIESNKRGITNNNNNDINNEPEGVQIVSKDYGVIVDHLNISEDTTKKYIDILSEQASKQTFKENKGMAANMMFHYGLRWGRREGNPKMGIKPMTAPINNNAYDGGKYYGYDQFDQNGNPLAPISDLEPIMEEIEQRTGISLEHYDSVIANIYLEGEYVYPHRDTSESKSAEKFPIVVYTLGNDSAIGIYDDNNGKTTFANKYDDRYPPTDVKSMSPTNEVETKNGSIYTFGVDGKGRFAMAHTTPTSSKKAKKYPPIKLPDGRTITNYTITLTFRRAADFSDQTYNPNMSNVLEDPNFNYEGNNNNNNDSNNNPSTSVSGEINANNSNPNNFVTKVNQFTYTLDTKTGKVIHNSKQGDKVETNQTQIGKVYAKYAEDMGMETQKFNKHNYVKVFDTVVNVKTGSIVMQKEILDKFNPKKDPVIDKPKEKAKREKGGPIILNEDQEKAKGEVLDFMRDPKRKSHSLSGFAGTGKTTLLNEILKGYRGQVVMSAPTNRAVAVMRGKSDGKVYSFLTIHQLLNLRGNVDIEKYDARKVEFSDQGSTSNSMENFPGSLMIVDEASMINDALYYDFLARADKYNIKVLFVGDNAQLNPVGQTHISKALDSTEKVSSLSIVERAENNAVLGESMAVRHSGNFTLINNMDAEGSGVTFTNDDVKFLDKMVEMFQSEDMAKNPLHLRVVASTNNEVNKANKYILSRLFPSQDRDFYPGEILLGYSNWGSDRLGGYKIINGGDYIVESSVPATEIIGGREFTGEMVTLQNIDDRSVYHTEFILSNLSLADNYALGDMIEQARENGRRNKKLWPVYFSLMESFMSTQDILNRKTGAVVSRTTILPGYAHTIHKSQGGTYSNVGIMAKGIEKGPGWSSKDKAQLKYVAVTRAERGVYINTSQEVGVGTTVYTPPTAMQVLNKGMFKGLAIRQVDSKEVRDTPWSASLDKRLATAVVDLQGFAEKFETKAWTNPQVEKDGSVATAFAEGAFRDIDEFTTFVFLHEFFHSRTNIKAGETIGQYEDRVNKEALNVLHLQFGVANTFFNPVQENSVEDVDGLNEEIEPDSMGGFNSARKAKDVFMENILRGGEISSTELLDDFLVDEFPNVTKC